MRLTRAVFFLTLSAFLGVTHSPSWARFVPRIGVEVEKDRTAYVTIHGRKAFHLKTYNGRLSPAERANITAGRLTALAQKGLDPKAIWYKQVGSSARVMVGDSMLVIATAAEARTRGMPSAKLAEAWVRNLRDLLSLPPLSAAPKELLVPLGEKRTVTVESLVAQPVEAVVANPAVISVDGQTKPGALIVTGLSIGESAITVKCGEFTAPVKVLVKKYAACAGAPAATALVTGWKAPAALVSRAARDSARRAVSLEPGASIRSVDIVSDVGELAPGQKAPIRVRIEAAGGDYIPAQLTVQTEVENKVLPPAPTAWLMYSNDPERVLRYQVLFVGKINPSQGAVRLLYHHQNMMGARIGFVIDAVNAGLSPAALHVIEGVSRPMVDTVAVGYRAGFEFIENHRNSIGRILDLAPQTRRVLVGQALDHMHTASGILELRQLSGEPLLIRVIAKPEELRIGKDEPETMIPAAGIDAGTIALSDHVYPQPLKQIEVTYTVGKPWVFVRLGKYALKHATQDRELYGNYGVTYEIKAALGNPTEAPHTVELVFEATAGCASAIFSVDGSITHVKSLPALGEAIVGRLIIPPGKTRTVAIHTMPLSGSAYPATLIIRPVGTTAAAGHGG
jgi:hypothetical protein